MEKLYKENDKQEQHNTKRENKERKILIQIKEKLISHNAMISKADKGHSIVILWKDSYREKIDTFIQKSELLITDKDLNQDSRKTYAVRSMKAQKPFKKSIIGNT